MTFSTNGAFDEQGQEARLVLNRADVERLLAGAGSPAKLNLAGISLNKADLSNLDLSGANLSEADLTRANLAGARLTSANLSEANLFIANLHGANLRGANLSRAKLNPAELGEADLSEADLSGADLSSADLSTTRLQDANFSGANLTDVYLTPRQKDQLLLSKVVVQGANTIRLVFELDEAPAPAAFSSGTSSLPTEKLGQPEPNLVCRIAQTSLSAVEFGLMIAGLGRLYAKGRLINQGRYSQLVAFTQTGDLAPEETGGLSIKSLHSVENGFELTFGVGEGDSLLAKALENALTGRRSLEEQAAKLIDELNSGLEVELKKVLVQLLLPELAQLSRLPGFSLKIEEAQQS
jgi:hypothetical protein